MPKLPSNHSLTRRAIRFSRVQLAKRALDEHRLWMREHGSTLSGYLSYYADPTVAHENFHQDRSILLRLQAKFDELEARHD